MTTVTTLKLTPAESAILDWLQHSLNAASRSQALRTALVEAARLRGLRDSEVEQVRDYRRTHRPRRSAKLCRLIGPRLHGEATIEG